MILLLVLDILLKILANHRIILEMVLSLALCLELLLYPPEEISFSQQAIDVDLVPRGKQQTLLEDAELAEL